MTVSADGVLRQRFHFGASALGDPSATEVAVRDAGELARAIAAHTVAADDHAVIEEFDERREAIVAALLPDLDPFGGYTFHSSLGALAVARVAVSWVPAGHVGLRHQPLDGAGIVDGLVGQGVDGRTAHSIVVGWSSVSPDFRARSEGLGLSMLAGLAERTLTRAERSSALSQVAYSPRCLTRLASVCKLLAEVRRLLSMLPSGRFGPALACAVAALALDRPERIIALFEGRANDALLEAFVECARVLVDLREHATPRLHDGAIVNAAARADLEPWRMALRDVASPVSEGGTVLGLRPMPMFGFARFPVSPDAVALEEWKRRSEVASSSVATADDATDRVLPLLPSVRGALAAIVDAGKGRVPTRDTVEAAGDLAWCIERARALAYLACGKPKDARAAMSPTTLALAPEGELAANRLLRFGSESSEPVSADEARRHARGLALDLVEQFARTIAGTAVGSAGLHE